MFWRKKSKEPPPLPTRTAAQTPPTGELSPEFKRDFQKELEAVADDPASDVLSAGIGMIKIGAKELLPGWLRQFGKSNLFVVSVEQSNPTTPFVFGPKGDRNYIAVFTRLELATECLREFPTLNFAMRLNGLDLLVVARDSRLGIWINPLNDACNLLVPADKIGRFIEEAKRGGA